MIAAWGVAAACGSRDRAAASDKQRPYPPRWPAHDRTPASRRTCIAAPGPGRIRFTYAITTPSGACRSTTTGRCYEKLILDGFQAGLSWITILRKRENFRAAFDRFAPEIIAHYDADKVAALMNDAGIVRNRAKIFGAIRSAQGYLAIMEKGPGFSALLWDFVGGHPAGEPPARHCRGAGGNAALACDF